MLIASNIVVNREKCSWSVPGNTTTSFRYMAKVCHLSPMRTVSITRWNIAGFGQNSKGVTWNSRRPSATVRPFFLGRVRRFQFPSSRPLGTVTKNISWSLSSVRRCMAAGKRNTSYIKGLSTGAVTSRNVADRFNWRDCSAAVGSGGDRSGSVCFLWCVLPFLFPVVFGLTRHDCYITVRLSPYRLSVCLWIALWKEYWEQGK